MQREEVMAEKEMDAERFWQIVERARWAPRFDYRLSARFLREQLSTWEDAKAFANRFGTLRSALYHAAHRLESGGGELPVGSDGMDDLIAHVIGLGRAEHEDHLARPERIRERAGQGDFTESFAYAIPYEEHYAPDRDARREESRRRDRVARDIGRDVEAVVVEVLERHADLAQDLRQSTVIHHVQSALRRALQRVLPDTADDG